MILPQLPLYAIAIICGLLSFSVTRLTMPRIIKKLEAADIVGKDIHKSWKPIVAEMGGFGILFGFIIGMFSGIYMHDILTFQLCVVLIVILLVGIIGIVDDLLVLSSKERISVNSALLHPFFNNEMSITINSENSLAKEITNKDEDSFGESDNKQFYIKIPNKSDKFEEHNIIFNRK